jgi:pimeloyl-ACP methyl ester carboxylesterase
MTTFALIHGGQHGGWCWERVQQALRERGYESVAPDLPIGDETAGGHDWAHAVKQALPDTAGDVIAVAHSMGGMALPVLATLMPLQRMVLLGAVFPQPGRVFMGYISSPEGADAITMPMTPPDPGDPVRGGCSWPVARQYFYHDCTEDDAVRAWDKLRDQAITVFTESPTLQSWPEVPTTSVIMAGDRCVNPAWSRRAARQIGADIVDLPGGHSPFLFAPEQLADTLISIAEPVTV